MLEDITMKDLPDEMHKYVKTHTYIEVKDIDLFRKKLLYTMPKTPLRVLHRERGINKKNKLPALYNRFYQYNESSVIHM